MPLRIITVLACLALCFTPPAFAEDAPEEPKTPVPAVLDFEMTTIDGETARLARYHGKVIMIVNVASRCGLTRQYKPLQELHARYAAEGLGVPANNFGRQEPGTDKQIREFCTQKFGVEFDMLSKVSVKGDDMTPLYQFLTSKETNPDHAGPIKWNFTKFLISREGKVINRFAPRVKPDHEKVTKAIEEALAAEEPKELCEEAVAYREAQAKAAEEAEQSKEEAKND